MGDSDSDTKGEQKKVGDSDNHICSCQQSTMIHNDRCIRCGALLLQVHSRSVMVAWVHYISGWFDGGRTKGVGC